jgi:hypothetical protein
MKTKKKTRVKMPKFTKEQYDRIATAMYRTWNAIGGDVLQSMQENEGRDSLSKDEMIEVVTDADNMTAYGNDKEAAKWVDELFNADYNGAYRQLRKLFEFKRYGY